jgi:hypothetical protein
VNKIGNTYGVRHTIYYSLKRGEIVVKLKEGKSLNQSERL